MSAPPQICETSSARGPPCASAESTAPITARSSSGPTRGLTRSDSVGSTSSTSSTSLDDRDADARVVQAADGPVDPAVDHKPCEVATLDPGVLEEAQVRAARLREHAARDRVEKPLLTLPEGLPEPGDAPVHGRWCLEIRTHACGVLREVAQLGDHGRLTIWKGDSATGQAAEMGHLGRIGAVAVGAGRLENGG